MNSHQVIWLKKTDGMLEEWQSDDNGRALVLVTITGLFPTYAGGRFDTALPAAEASLLGSDITIGLTDNINYLRIYACISVSGILRVARSQGTTVTENLNSGRALVAGAAYMFDIIASNVAAETFNLRYSVTGGTINSLYVYTMRGTS